MDDLKRFLRAMASNIEASDHIGWSESRVKHLRAAADRIEQLESALLSVNAVAIERGDKFGACDQIDNTGQPYPSQWLADLLASIAPTSDATSHANSEPSA
jgi:hypothetical protein